MIELNSMNMQYDPSKDGSVSGDDQHSAFFFQKEKRWRKRNLNLRPIEQSEDRSFASLSKAVHQPFRRLIEKEMR